MKSFYDRHKGWIDQVLHVVVFGGLGYIEPALGIMALVIYELTALKIELGPVTIGQWPPGTPFQITGGQISEDVPPSTLEVTSMARVEDLRLDLFVSLCAIALASMLAWEPEPDPGPREPEISYAELWTKRDDGLIEFSGLNVDDPNPVEVITFRDNLWVGEKPFVEVELTDSPSFEKKRPGWCESIEFTGTVDQWERILTRCGYVAYPVR